MGFLFPKAPKPVPPANPSVTAPTTNPFSEPMRSGSSFIGGGNGLTTRTKSTAKTSLIGGG